MIVRYPDLMRELFSTHIFIPTYPRIKANALCSEMWRTGHEPRIFLDQRGRDRDDTL